MSDQGLQLAVAAVGSRWQLAKRLNLTISAVARWHEIPIKRVLEVEKVTGIDRAKLRPDLFSQTHSA